MHKINTQIVINVRSQIVILNEGLYDQLPYFDSLKSLYNVNDVFELIRIVFTIA